jgi:uncharacterized protein YdiU (UPF0061 family)
LYKALSFTILGINTMTTSTFAKKSVTISTLNQLAALVDYSFMSALNCDPDATDSGEDYRPRQVFSGHYVPVKPTAIQDPEYIAHSERFFAELGFANELAMSQDFIRLFSGDTSKLPNTMHKFGWATGYALSIYGTEYIQQCPFQTGNGYGDGRAISVLEAVINGKRWEMQLKGAGRTPYCRGADGRAVLRSSVREFLAQEHMHSLGVPTSRSLSLFVSTSEKVKRPWYCEGSYSENPDRIISEAVAISTRVAPSFIRVGQLELFARRARKKEHPDALNELKKIVLHLIEREYADVIDNQLSTAKQVLLLAREFCNRLTSLVANWIRVGFCQGNFNSDNCAAGGFTLDYGPFGFCDEFNAHYQPWTGGGHHFSFMNQPNAAQRNFEMFCSALQPLLTTQYDLNELTTIQKEFTIIMHTKLEKMWAAKLGIYQLGELDKPFFTQLLSELDSLMKKTSVDYTLFFRELSSVPNTINCLKKSFYDYTTDEIVQEKRDKEWAKWLEKWQLLLTSTNNVANLSPQLRENIAKQMKLVNPKYILREWFLVPAYKQAANGNYALVRTLQHIMTQPYAELSKEIEDEYYRLKPPEFFNVGGLSHLSCSS